jgi:hypothetical protein
MGQCKSVDKFLSYDAYVSGGRFPDEGALLMGFFSNSPRFIGWTLDTSVHCRDSILIAPSPHYVAVRQRPCRS